MKKYQKSINECLMEGDVEVAVFAVKQFRRCMKKCMFFLRINGFSEGLKCQISDSIINNVSAFQLYFRKYIRKLEQNESNYFIQELSYLSRKFDLEKIVMECMQDG